MHERDELPMWTIYASPADFPGRYVVRRSVIGQGGRMRMDPAPSFVGPSLDAARDSLPHERGLVCMVRAPSDPPQIVEVWF